MGKLKERWEFIIGYVALIVSLSAFKNELTDINLNLGFIIFTAAQYLFILILSFLVCLHLYLIPFLLSSTKYANLKIFSYLESVSYIIFVSLAASPFIVLLAFALNSAINIFKTIPADSKDTINSIISFVVTSIFFIISIIVAEKIRQQKYSTQKRDLEDQEISEFEKVQKLFEDGYYSQSILEAFKVLELHLKRLIVQKDIPFRSNKIQDLISVSRKLQLISDDEVAIVDRIREMRNSAAHIDVEFTKKEAEFAISFLRKLISKTNNK